MARLASLSRVLAAFLLAAGPGVLAQTAPVQLPELTHKRLLNDFQIVIAATPQLADSMTIGLMTRYGAAFDPVDKGGLALLTTRLIGRATQDRAGSDIQDELRVLGATLEARCDWDGLRFLVRGPSARFERMLLLLYQVIGEAVFNDADFAAVRGELLKGLETPEDPRRQSRIQFETGLFRGTSFGRPMGGNKASLANLTIGDVRYFHRRFFTPNAAALAIAGSAPTPAVLQKAARIWGVWVRKDEVPFTFLPPRMPSSRPVTLVDDPGSTAAQFLMGNLWLTREDPGYHAAALAARILQERLNRLLPTSLITVAFEARRMPGPFYVQGQAAAEQVGAELQKVLQVVEELQTGTVSADELAAGRKHLLDAQRASLTTTDGICEQILDAELYRLGTNFMATYRELLERNNADSVKEAAKQWIFPGGVLIHVRGPAVTLKPVLEKLGTVNAGS